MYRNTETKKECFVLQNSVFSTIQMTYIYLVQESSVFFLSIQSNRKGLLWNCEMLYEK